MSEAIKRMLTLQVMARAAGCSDPDEGLRWALARGYIVVADDLVEGREYRYTGDGVAAISRFVEASA